MLYKILGLFVLIASCIFFFDQINIYSSELNNIFSNRQLTKTLALLIPLYAFTIFNGSMIWYTLMRSFASFDRMLLTSVYIYMTSQFAKYLPGNIGHHAGRIYLTKKHNYNTLQVISSMAIENILPVAISFILSLYVLQQQQSRITNYIHININHHVIILLITAALLLTILFFFRINIYRLIRKYIDKELRFRNIFFSLILISINFLALGFILFSLIEIYSEDAPTDYFLITSIFAISWLLGFITPGSPGGIGVREALLVAFLAPIYGNAMAIWLSIMLRIITTLGDGLAFLIGISLTPFVKRLNVKNT